MLVTIQFMFHQFRDAEKQFKSSLKQQESIHCYLELCKVYIRLDQPNTAMDICTKALESFPKEVCFYLLCFCLFSSLSLLLFSFLHVKMFLRRAIIFLSCVSLSLTLSILTQDCVYDWNRAHSRYVGGYGKGGKYVQTGKYFATICFSMNNVSIQYCADAYPH
jgi:hypothetical protein